MLILGRILFDYAPVTFIKSPFRCLPGVSFSFLIW